MLPSTYWKPGYIVSGHNVGSNDMYRERIVTKLCTYRPPATEFPPDDYSSDSRPLLDDTVSRNDSSAGEKTCRPQLCTVCLVDRSKASTHCKVGQL
jgi:hypothetical protein